MEFASLIVSARSLRRSSSSACCSASSFIFSISSSERPLFASTRMDCSLPVSLSSADTFRMPSALMSNVTSICGVPRGAGGMPSRWKRPSVRLSLAISRSPCRTCTSTEVWLSAAVEKTSLSFVGIVVLASIRVVITPPSVSMPRLSGVTSSSSTSSTSPLSTPPCTAAPRDTTSSGFTDLLACLPKKSSTVSCTSGTRVDPPTRMTSSTSLLECPASSRAFSICGTVFSTRSSIRFSKVARLRSIFRCCGPSSVAVINGRLIVVVLALDSSILASSAASFSRCRAIGSSRRSTPVSCSNSSAMWSMRRLSKLSPPRCVSPYVALTSKTPSPSSRMETSKVPPPRSYTATT